MIFTHQLNVISITSSFSCSTIDDDTLVALRKDDGLMQGYFINASYITVNVKAILSTSSTLRHYK